MTDPTPTLDTAVDVVAENLQHPEGPDVMPDGRLVFVEGFRSRVVTWSEEDGVQQFAHVGGKPYAVVVGSDDHLYVTQSTESSGPWTGKYPAPPSIQKVSPDGAKVEVLCTEVDGVTLSRPNDLTFGPDGRLYFTDSGIWGVPVHTDPGYVFALNPDGSGELVCETGPAFPNGIAFMPDGSLIWSESTEERITRRAPDGTVDLFAQLPEGHHAEGLKVDVQGRVWITTFEAGTIDVFSPTGELLAIHDIGCVPVNLAYRDGCLYIADMGPRQPEDRDETGATIHGRLLRMAVDVPFREFYRGAIG